MIKTGVGSSFRLDTLTYGVWCKLAVVSSTLTRLSPAAKLVSPERPTQVGLSRETNSAERATTRKRAQSDVKRTPAARPTTLRCADASWVALGGGFSCAARAKRVKNASHTAVKSGEPESCPDHLRSSRRDVQLALPREIQIQHGT